MYVRVYFRTRNYGEIRKIVQRFRLCPQISVNYETFGNVTSADFPLLEETVKRGFIEIRK
jgi:hypothetical protein